MDPGRESIQERAWHFKSLRTSEAVLPVAASSPALPSQPQESKVVRQKITGAVAPEAQAPTFWTPHKNAKSDKGDKIPCSRGVSRVLSRRGWWSPESTP